MNRWYEESFGEDYLKVYEHRNMVEAEKDIEKISRMVKLRNDWKILDLCCGSGRHLRALYKKGCTRLTGIDLSSSLLKKAKEYKNDSIKYIQGDMRHIPFIETFNMVISLFTSFGYFQSDKENFNVLKEIFLALIPEGVYFLDYINRPFLKKNLVPRSITYKNGNEIREKRWFSSDSFRIEKEITIINNANKKVYYESVRLFSFEDLWEMFKEAGFKNIRYFGSMDGNKYSKECPRLIMIGEKKD